MTDWPMVGPMLPAQFLRPGSTSFSDLLSEMAPTLTSSPSAAIGDVAPHGTTIVALTHASGVLMAGDRRATMGNLIAKSDTEKVFAADDASVVGIAGSAGLALELVRLFQVELEHYEKLEGVPLSLDGKANRLATMLRSNLPLAMQGLGVVPLFAGYDHEASDPGTAGRIFSYDVTGGRYPEQHFYAVGSGSVFARGSLKKLYAPGMTEQDASLVAINALYDAADDDSATGGPDQARRIYPIVVSVTASGARRLADGDVAELVDRVVTARRTSPDGPRASLD